MTSSASGRAASSPPSNSGYPWDFAATDAARCAALLTLSGQPGDFVVARSKTDASELANAPQAITIWLNVEGLPRTSRCVLIAGQKEHPAIVRSLDMVNEDMIVQWCDGAFVSSKRVGLQDVFAHNPRLLVHPVAVAIKTTAHNTYRLGHGFDPAAPEFSSVADLIAHYQNHGIRIRSFQREGENVYVRLAAEGASWNLVRQGFSLAEVRSARADWKIPLVMSRSEVDKLMTGYWCQAGDVLIRFADGTEKGLEPTAAAFMSMLTAIRVYHLPILQTSEGLYFTSRQPSLVFATLGQLIDYLYMNLRLENIPCRRLVVPNSYLENSESIQPPRQTTFVTFGRESGYDGSSMSSDNEVYPDDEVVPEETPGKQPRRSSNDHPGRRGVPIDKLTRGTIDEDAEEDALAYDTDLRDVQALAAYEVEAGRDQPSESTPQAQTAFILGLGDAKSRVQEAVIDHFTPLADALSARASDNIDDRLPLPRSPLRTLSSIDDVAAAAVAAFQHKRGLRNVVGSAPASLASWSRLLHTDAQDEIDEVFA